MSTFVFYRTSENNHINTAALLSAHGFCVLGQPTTYVRILGQDHTLISVQEGDTHQSLYAIEAPIEHFTTLSLSALLDNGGRASDGRHVVLDVPSEIALEARIGSTADICVIPLLESVIHEFHEHNGPILRSFAHTLTRTAGNFHFKLPVWLLSCARNRRGTNSGIPKTTSKDTTISPRLSYFYRNLPFELPALGRVDRTCLLAGKPSPFVQKSGVLLAWALLFAARSNGVRHSVVGDFTPLSHETQYIGHKIWTHTNGNTLPHDSRTLGYATRS